ncbi:heparinase II/III-family protein [Bacteroides sp.]|uniref:heparinase II/III family protein n=1 Tax=Bacteroides sp. TaxID=29523 RepID=UPI002FC696CE
MKQQLIGTLLLILIGCSSAQAYTERNLLQKKADEATVKAALVMNQKWVKYPTYHSRPSWDSLLGSQKAMLIAQGEKLLKYQWKLIPATAYLEYERSGERNIMQNPYEENRCALNTLMLAELAEGKGRFIDQLINGVYQGCEMTSWVLSAHLPRQASRRSLPDFREQIIDLGSGGYGSLMAWIHYFFAPTFDEVNPAIAVRMRHAIQERILDPFMNSSDAWWMAFNWKPGEIINNWNPWCNSNVLQCFLLMENDPGRLAKAVHRSMQSVDKFINFVKADGACEEGTSYWGHAAGKLYDYLQLLSDGTDGKISLFGEPMVRSMGEYISRSYVGNGWVVNFADASAKGGGDAPLIYRYGQAVGSNEMMQFAAYLVEEKKAYITLGNDAFRSLESIASYAQFARTTPRHASPDVTWYPETEFCYLKNNKGLFLAAKGGFNNESHNHNDVGTFSLYVNTVPMLIDAGVGTYTRKTFGSERYTIWTMQSNYHNLPLINGVPQRFGQEYKATQTTCNMRKMTFSTDIAGAYPEEAGVKSWVRAYALAGKQLTITDKFALNQTTEPTQVNFLTWGKVVLKSPGKLTIEAAGQQVELDYPTVFDATVEPIALDDPRLSTVWGKEIYRIVLKAKEQKSAGTYTFVIRN